YGQELIAVVGRVGRRIRLDPTTRLCVRRSGPQGRKTKECNQRFGRKSFHISTSKRRAVDRDIYSPPVVVRRINWPWRNPPAIPIVSSMNETVKRSPPPLGCVVHVVPPSVVRMIVPS